MDTRNWRQAISPTWVIVPAIRSQDPCALCGRTRGLERVAVFPQGLTGDFLPACPVHQRDIEHWRERQLRKEAR